MGDFWDAEVATNAIEELEPEPEELAPSIQESRAYQKELLEESIKRNVIIALDTGSGKTHIAVLRMRHETERNPNKICWFFAPTVGLCEQQRDVIEKSLPVPVGMITGADAPDQWTDKALWRTLLTSHRIIVSTPQVLLDALRHGYVDMSREISLLVFDEAHHAADGHPYHMIMQEFYHKLPPNRTNGSNGERARPSILGLTASPMFGVNVDVAFQKLEQSLDCVICSARKTRAELAQYVHIPTFKNILYPPPPFKWGITPSPSHNVNSLKAVLDSLDIDQDPAVITLRAKVAKLPRNSPERIRLDQKLSKMVDKRETFTHKGLRDFFRTANEICYDLGVWGADWYVQKVLEQALAPIDPLKHMFLEWQEKEKAYLLAALQRIEIRPVSFEPEEIARGVSAKTTVLIETLLEEKKEWDDVKEIYSGLVFVTRRDTVLTLSAILSHHPRTTPHFSIGSLLGSSNSPKRRSLLDITHTLLTSSLAQTLRAFRIGEKNVIVATAVAEEGIDVRACGSVVRWDPPQNMVSWVQSRGRARKQKSSFGVMFEDGMGAEAEGVVRRWEAAERKMIAAYLREREEGGEEDEDGEDEEGEANGNEEEGYFRVEETGAVLTLASAVPHLGHFCSVIPSTRHFRHEAIYTLDPPDYPFEFHLLPKHRRRLLSASNHNDLSNRPDRPEEHRQQQRLAQKHEEQYIGPFGASVTLPRAVKLPNHPTRTFSTPRVHETKKRARMWVAFEAYKALWEGGLVDGHLLPWGSGLARGQEEEEEVRKALEEVEGREGVEVVSVQMRAWVPGPLTGTERIKEVGEVEGGAKDGQEHRHGHGQEHEQEQGYGNRWWLSELTIEGVATVKLLTLVPIPGEFGREVEYLYDSTAGAASGTREVRIRVIGLYGGSEAELMAAKVYTREVFSVFYGTKMRWEELGFLYLIIPPDPSSLSSQTWKARRKWADGLHEKKNLKPRPENRYVVDAVQFGKTFACPRDVFLVRDVLHGNTARSRPYEFVRWRKRVSVEEVMKLMELYPISLEDAMDADMPPVIEARTLPRRMNFLVPRREKGEGKEGELEEKLGEMVLIPAQYATVALAPETDIRVSMLLPSILRILSIKLTTYSLRITLLPPSLQSLPLSLFRTAHVAPVASESYNYQRLETLGDAVLKMVVSVQLLGQFGLWHEGYLARRKDHVVANGSLARGAVRVGLYRWVVRDRFIARGWTPEVWEGGNVRGREDGVKAEAAEEDQVVYPRNSVQQSEAQVRTQTQDTGPGPGASNETKAEKAEREDSEQKAALSTKMMADVVEAMIGASYLHAGFQGGIDCISAFGLDVVWKTIPERIEQMLDQMEPVELDAIPPQLTHVEAILGYTFERKPLLIEALMHASFQGELETRSYERMEFLGDAVLDMIVTEMLYRAEGKEYGPGHLHMKKSACVNAHFLGYVCLRACTRLQTQVPLSSMAGGAKVVEGAQVVYLWQCMLHSSTRILADLMDTFARYEVLEREVEYMLKQDSIFPWAALTRLQIPKFFSDIVESLIGAVYLDTEGDMERVTRVLEVLGVLPVLRRIIEEDVDVLHPVSRIAMMAAKAQMEVRYSEEVVGGFATVELLVDEEVVHSACERYKGRASIVALKFQVAEESVDILAGMVGWGGTDGW